MASFTSAANVGGKCYLKGTLFKDMSERFVEVEHLKQFDFISDCNKQPARIRSIVERTGPHEVVTLTAGSTSLSVTSSHRIVVIRGGLQEPAPARALRMGDEVVVGHVNQTITQQPQLSMTDAPAFDIIFEPDTPVEAWNALPPYGILSRGSRQPRPRRNRGVASSGHFDADSMPCTDDPFY